MKNKIRTFINKIPELPLIRHLIQWSKVHTLPGFQGVSIYATLSFIIMELRRNDLETRASAMSYSFFIALFPSLIFLFTLSAYLPKSWDFYHTLEASLNSILPDQTQDYLWQNIVSSLKPKAKGSILSIGFFLALYFASNGILTMMRGFDKTYHTSFYKRSFVKKNAVAILITFLFGILLILSVVVIVLGNLILNWLFAIVKLSYLANLSIGIMKYLILFILFYITIDIIYRIGPALRRPINSFSPGTIFATVTSIITSVLFAYFLDNFSTYHKVYGAISALIITLVWIRINVVIILLGFELNAGIIVNRDLMKQVNEKISEYDL
ncbi:MAG: YihY/virulence factor BrkB family protein [Saprospiraceae bacterium]